MKNDSILLFDMDCGVCTSFSRFLHRLISIPIRPMQDPDYLELGKLLVGEEEFWKSFHIYRDSKIYTEQAAIIALAEEFPLSAIAGRVVRVPVILKFLNQVLRIMQQRRQQSCQWMT
ncbi:MAG: DUF393 domain-containing protein [Candidatus Heimdallarchaeota archaeon]|nr:DUF393 domain-containing protein [Candidatus Heimdallarchaeota archaeon]